MADVAPRTIHLVFKTHLDIGFTDLAANVRRQYHERFIPQAIATAAHFFREDAAHPAFIWTTGAWLIWDHLETQPRARVRALEEAIGRGLIRWHALPFTTHSELLSPALFRAGLSYAAELDRRFGTKTIAAKLTDVPGHARGIVPLLAEAGVKFLHIGINAASRVPEVPELFRWQAAGAEVLVMVQNSYGATHFPPGVADGLSFAHTNDNLGPQSVPQTVEVYRELQHAHPGIAIRAATLDDYARRVWPRRAEFPVVDLELGDSWIHGAGSDPQKLQRYLALGRLYDKFAAEPETPQRLAFARRLAMVAEHTWGVDIKSYLRDETAWDRPAFAAARQADYRFAFTESSWAEQRAYVDAAVAALAPPDRALARAALRTTRVPPPSPRPAAAPATSFDLKRWGIELDPHTGDLTRLSPPAARPDAHRTLGGLDAPLFGFRYETYDGRDMARFRKSYVTQEFDWALRDFDKPGLVNAATARSAVWVPKLVDTAQRPDRLQLGLALDAEAHRTFGAPARLETIVRPLDAARLELSLVLRGKPANRMPEAGFALLRPAGAGAWEFLKLGLWQPGDRLARNGGGPLQAVSAVRTRLAGGLTLTVEPLDTPLVAPAIGDFMTYDPEPPDFSAGLRFNLFNNKWGTNFTMWWEGDLLARFILTLEG